MSIDGDLRYFNQKPLTDSRLLTADSHSIEITCLFQQIKG